MGNLNTREEANSNHNLSADNAEIFFRGPMSTASDGNHTTTHELMDQSSLYISQN